jgi:ribosomal protein S18 acetylase RimI-like enzyme
MPPSQSPDPSPGFRPAREADAPELLAMMRVFYEHEGIEFDPAAARRALLKLIGDANLGEVFIILSGEETAGYAILSYGFSLEFGGRDALVDELFLREEFRGRGIGRSAMVHLASAARQGGAHAIHLEVERKNARAQALYRSMGYEDHDRYLMTRQLGPREEPACPNPAR